MLYGSEIWPLTEGRKNIVGGTEKKKRYVAGVRWQGRISRRGVGNLWLGGYKIY